MKSQLYASLWKTISVRIPSFYANCTMSTNVLMIVTVKIMVHAITRMDCTTASVKQDGRDETAQKMSTNAKTTTLVKMRVSVKMSTEVILALVPQDGRGQTVQKMSTNAMITLVKMMAHVLTSKEAITALVSHNGKERTAKQMPTNAMLTLVEMMAHVLTSKEAITALVSHNGKERTAKQMSMNAMITLVEMMARVLTSKEAITALVSHNGKETTAKQIPVNRDFYDSLMKKTQGMQEIMLGPPQNVTVTHRSRTDLLIEWYPPVILKGNVIKYEIQYQAKERPYLSFYNEDENETTFELNDDTKFGKVAVNITSLDPSTVYEIQMSAFTTVGQGKEVAKTVPTLVETDLTPLRKRDVQVSASEQNFEIRLPVLRQKYATHYVVSIVELSERKYGIMTAEFNKTDNVTVFHLNVDNTYTSFKGIVWGVAVYQIYIGTQSRVRENKHIVWSDGITLKVPPWFNLIRVFVATILTVIFITGVTILCRLQSYCRNEQYHRNEEKDLKRLKSPNRCCEVDQSDAEVFNVNTNLEERYAKFHGGDLETKESSKDELKKNLAVERTDEEEKLAKGEGDIVYRKALVEVVVEKGSSDEDFREETSTMIYASENCRNNEHNLASEVIPKKVHPINGKGKLDLIDQIVLEPSDAIYNELSEKEGFIKIDAVSDDAHDEDGVKRAKQDYRGSKTKDVCDQQELGKSNPLLEGTTKCDLKETEAQYLKEDDSMRMRETKARTASDSDDDVYDDFDDVNPMLNESDSNGNKKPGLLKAMLKLLKGDYNAIKKQAEMGVLEVNYQGNDQTEEHDIYNAAIKTDEQLDVLKKGCPREDEGLQHDAFAESISNCRFQKVKSDLNLEPDFPLEISKDIKREDKLSFYTENKVHHSEENELRCIKNVVTENERPIESNVSETTTVPDIHDVTPANIKGSRVSSMTVNNGWIDENGDRKRNAADHVSHSVDISDNDTANEKCRSKFKLESQDSESKNSVGLELYDNTRDKVYLDTFTKGKVGVVDCFEEVYDDTEVEEKQIPVTTHCAHDVYPNPFTDNDFEMTDKSLADSLIDVYDETSVEEGCRLNTANKEIDAFNVPSSQEIYDESCVDSDQEYINSDHRKLPARPKMSSNSQTKHIPDNVIDFYTKPDVNGATERTSEIYEMIPAEENPCKGRQTSIFYTFRNKILSKPRNRGSKNVSFRKLPPTPSENRLSVNPFWGDVPSYSNERSVETNIDDDIYEELSEDDETAKI
ncbi:hypothetical protein HOLleu_29599 [Holothuria leucospilota]|uniref:Fibronectin type-III domain-containing protein n=1 Tax=Holothuria leucospilota TaxID=206669 RepID=A0A9Q1H2D9_HOLLE|nr:hypothetical protein HOLleu_29599 [Holothuria leucospilota]